MLRTLGEGPVIVALLSVLAVGQGSLPSTAWIGIAVGCGSLALIVASGRFVQSDWLGRFTESEYVGRLWRTSESARLVPYQSLAATVDGSLRDVEMALSGGADAAAVTLDPVDDADSIGSLVPSEESVRAAYRAQGGNLLRVQHEIRAFRDDDGYVIAERVSIGLLGVLSMMLPVVVLGGSLFAIGVGIVTLAAVAPVMIGATLVLAVGSYVLSQSVPGIIERAPGATIQTYGRPEFGYLLLVAALVGVPVLLSTSAVVTLTSAIGLVALSASYSIITPQLIATDSRLTTGLHRLPAPTLEYTVGLAVLACGVFLPLLSGLQGSASPSVSALAGRSFVGCVAVVVFLLELRTTYAVTGVELAVSGQRETDSVYAHLVLIGCCAVLSYSLLTGVWLLWTGPIFESTVQSLVASLPALLAGGFLVAGLGRQTRRTVQQRLELFDDVSPCRADATESVAVPVYELPEDSLTVKAYDSGFGKAILVSETVVDLLDHDELVAVLAHEEAHAVEYVDAWLSQYVPLLSFVLGVGRAPLYAALRSRSREIRADLSAAREVGSQSLIDALESLRTERAKRLVDDRVSGDAVAPTALSPGGSASSLDRLFTPFFGAYPSQQHPSIEERIDALERADTEETVAPDYR